jgi:hypothetical protein
VSGVPARSFLAMAYHRLGEAGRARQELGEAHRLFSASPKEGERVSWLDRLVARAALREAEAVLRQPAGPVL